MDGYDDDFFVTDVKIEAGNDFYANAADEDISDAAFEALLRDLGITNDENDATFVDLKISAVKLDNFTCAVCGGDVDTREMMHVLKHAKDSVDFMCDLCFAPRKSDRIKCSECDKDFSTVGNLTAHVDAVHRKLKRFECKECHHAFSTRSKLKIHENCVHKKIKKYKCCECNSMFSKRTNLRRHVAAVHEKAKLNIKACSDCERSFSNRDSLKRHFKAAHLKVNYICDHCGVRFVDRSNMVVHIRSIHERLKPFVCGRCNSAFGDRSTLRKHRKTKCHYNS